MVINPMSLEKMGKRKKKVEMIFGVGIGIRVDLHAAPNRAYRFGRCGSYKHVAPMALIRRAIMARARVLDRGRSERCTRFLIRDREFPISAGIFPDSCSAK